MDLAEDSDSDVDVLRVIRPPQRERRPPANQPGPSTRDQAVETDNDILEPPADEGSLMSLLESVMAVTDDSSLESGVAVTDDSAENNEQAESEASAAVSEEAEQSLEAAMMVRKIYSCCGNCLLESTFDFFFGLRRRCLAGLIMFLGWTRRMQRKVFVKARAYSMYTSYNGHLCISS